MTTPQGAVRHRAQELMLDGLRTIREEIPDGTVDQAIIEAIDGCIESLIPMHGFGVPNATARLSVIAHALQVLADGLIPYVTIENTTPLEPIASACGSVAKQLKAQIK
ncbi:MAG: hypothetical protein O2812_01875 [Chloroflexi bacterium]|nr:hypothetical protein [Chloroflexota bacterium]